MALGTLTAIENGNDHRASTADRIVQAFAENGVEITNGDGTGAKLLNSARTRADRDSSAA